jgi:hypothetical protein
MSYIAGLYGEVLTNVLGSSDVTSARNDCVQCFRRPGRSRAGNLLSRRTRVGRRSAISISRTSLEEDQRRSCSRRMRQEGSPPISRSCPTCARMPRLPLSGILTIRLHVRAMALRSHPRKYPGRRAISFAQRRRKPHSVRECGLAHTHRVGRRWYA